MASGEFDLSVRRLNEEFGLDITPRGSSRFSIQDGKARDIYFKLKGYHDTDRPLFDRCLASMKSTAHRHLKDWVYKPHADTDTLLSPSVMAANGAPLGARGLETSARADLYKDLEEIVYTTEEPRTRPLKPRPKKRESDEHDGGSSKRTRSGSRISPPGPTNTLATRVKSQHPDPTASRPGLYALNNSASTSKISLQSATFSVPQEPGETPFTSQDTTVNDRKLIDSQEFPISTAEHEALIESFSMVEGALNPSDYQHDNDIKRSRSLDLGTRFQGIWPALPENGLNHKELSVLWEITRTALHCEVDLRALDGMEPLDLANSDTRELSWYSDQRTLWARLRQHPLFYKGPLPPLSPTEAWDISLGKTVARVPHNVTVFKAELVHRPKGERAFQVKLQPLESRLSHPLDRRFGFDRFLELVVPVLDKEDPDQAKVTPWLSGEHAFLGRRWQPFFIKASKKTNRERKAGETTEKQAYFYTVYMFAVDGNNFCYSENPSKAPQQPIGPAAGKGAVKCNIRGLLDWALNLSDPRNTEQPTPKLFSRLSLSLSRTIPAKILERHQIIHEPDDFRGPNGMVMNDGLGLMSVSLARSLAEALRLPDTPCAFQGRLGPAKGVWIIDINDNFYNNDFWIKTYPSQRKWECDFQDPHHRTFGVKNFSSEKCLKPTNLNLQFIPVLMYGAKHKGRMRHSIEKRLKTCLEQETSAEKDALDDPRRLLQLVYKAGPEKEITFKGGLPPGDEDRAFLMLVSGFTRENRFLNDLLWKLRQEKIAELKKRMKIQIPCSTYLSMVVDLWGILEPGEVHISFSNKFFAEGDESQGVPGFSDTMVDEMDVLVARSPAHLPSDIQRVRAVSHPKLRKLKDMIVFSVKGSRPLADYLSGGDYDGDQAWVCWDRDIVTNFENTRRDPPKCDFVDEGYLQKDRCTFKDLLREHRGIVAYHEFLCRSLSFSMQQDMLGICTKHKEWTCYKLGVDHPATMRESVLLSDLVDQAKAGITFTREAWKAFKKSLEIPGILDQPEYEKEKASDKWLRDVNRRGREPHVLDYLKFQVADRIIDATLREFHQALKDNPKPNAYDSDLTSLYDEFYQWAAHSNSGGRCMRYLESACRGLEKLWDQGVASADVDFEDNVQRVHERFMAIEPPDKAASSRTFNCLNDAWMRCASIKDRPLLAHPGSVDWNDGNISRWTLLKASTLFKVCYKTKELMCWHVAGRQLMHIKASVVGGRSKDTIPILVVPDIFAVLRPDNRAIKRLAAAANQAAGEESVLALEEVNDLDEEGTVVDDV